MAEIRWTEEAANWLKEIHGNPPVSSLAPVVELSISETSKTGEA